MPDGSLPSPAPTASRTLSAASLEWIAGWTLPATFVLLFVGIQYQPHVTRGSASVRLVDLALLGVVVVAIASYREDSRRLDGSRWLWITAGAFLAFVVAASIYPLASDSSYHWTTHLVTAGRYVFYALLAPAVALLAREPRALQRLWATVVVWSLVAAAVALVQFAGADIFEAWPPGDRQPSFTGIPELGALGGAAMAVGFLGAALAGHGAARGVDRRPRRRRAVRRSLQQRRGPDRRRRSRRRSGARSPPPASGRARAASAPSPR